MALLGLAGRGFFPAPLVGFSPLPITLGSGKVCWNVILLEYCAGEPHDSRHHDCDKWGLSLRVRGYRGWEGSAVTRGDTGMLKGNIQLWKMFSRW